MISPGKGLFRPIIRRLLRSKEKQEATEETEKDESIGIRQFGKRVEPFRRLCCLRYLLFIFQCELTIIGARLCEF